MLVFYTQGVNLIPVCKKLVTSLKENGVEAKVSTDLRGAKPTDVIFRWGTLLPTPDGLDKVINRQEPVALARNKIRSRKALGDLAVPTFFQPAEVKDFPVVVRPSTHHGGKNLHVAKDFASFNRIIAKLPKWYASPLMKKEREFRIFVLGNHVTSVSERFPNPDAPDQVAWNLQAGGSLKNCKFDNWPLDLCGLAIKATQKFGLDFAAVDGMLDAKGESYIFEVNTAPGLNNPYTLNCLAASLASHIEEGALPLVKGKKITWKTYRHPALFDGLLEPEAAAPPVKAAAPAPKAAPKVAAIPVEAKPKKKYLNAGLQKCILAYLAYVEELIMENGAKDEALAKEAQGHLKIALNAIEIGW